MYYQCLTGILTHANNCVLRNKSAHSRKHLTCDFTNEITNVPEAQKSKSAVIETALSPVLRRLERRTLHETNYLAVYYTFYPLKSIGARVLN